MKITKYIFLAILLIINFSCMNRKENLKLNLENKNSEYYYCAVLEAGIDFNIMHKILSIDKFNQNISILKTLEPNNDANYYKLEKEDDKIILHGYSMITNELRELIKVENKTRRLLYTKIFKPNSSKTKECYRTYVNKGKTMTSIELCDDNTKNIRYFDYTPKWKNYTIREHIIYKDNKLVNRLIHNTSYSIVEIYDENGTLLKKGKTMGESDFCVPYMAYQTDKYFK